MTPDLVEFLVFHPDTGDVLDTINRGRLQDTNPRMKMAKDQRQLFDDLCKYFYQYAYPPTVLNP